MDERYSIVCHLLIKALDSSAPYCRPTRPASLRKNSQFEFETQSNNGFLFGIHWRWLWIYSSRWMPLNALDCTRHYLRIGGGRCSMRWKANVQCIPSTLQSADGECLFADRYCHDSLGKFIDRSPAPVLHSNELPCQLKISNANVGPTPHVGFRWINKHSQLMNRTSISIQICQSMPIVIRPKWISNQLRLLLFTIPLKCIIPCT